jgi:hypothetical protein
MRRKLVYSRASFSSPPGSAASAWLIGDILDTALLPMLVGSLTTWRACYHRKMLEYLRVIINDEVRLIVAPPIHRASAATRFASCGVDARSQAAACCETTSRPRFLCGIRGGGGDAFVFCVLRVRRRHLELLGAPPAASRPPRAWLSAVARRRCPEA